MEFLVQKWNFYKNIDFAGLNVVAGPKVLVFINHDP